MGLHECMDRITLDEYALWQAYFEMQDQEPTQEIYYLMQIACEVVRGRVKNPRRVKMSDFRLQFKEAVQRQETDEEREERHRLEGEQVKATWLARMTVQPVVIPAPKS